MSGKWSSLLFKDFRVPCPLHRRVQHGTWCQTETAGSLMECASHPTSLCPSEGLLCLWITAKKVSNLLTLHTELIPTATELQMASQNTEEPMRFSYFCLVRYPVLWFCPAGHAVALSQQISCVVLKVGKEAVLLTDDHKHSNSVVLNISQYLIIRDLVSLKDAFSTLMDRSSGKLSSQKKSWTFYLNVYAKYVY